MKGKRKFNLRIRIEESNDIKIKHDYYQRIAKYADRKCLDILEEREPEPYYVRDLDIE